MISLQQNNQSIRIRLECDLINTSSQRFDLVALQRSITEQIQRVYHASIGKYSLDVAVSIKLLNSEYQCSPKKILFQIVDVITGNNPAEADFKGLRIKLNKAHVNDIITQQNIRTIPHEIGHLMGWDHPHANAQFESINLQAHLLEQQLTEVQRQYNLMSQSWYAQRAHVPLDRAMELTEQQIELFVLSHQSGKLNSNRHLKHFLFWKKIV